ncbi:hypothetical protein K450DRAFT_226621 [Umbelopsis ramanniana AG]|uniref:Uncharacterized protein n=1 Tax=Umbelopsis ramanniana AG TaxID=1314678 RepID=A0AAD5EFG4_UMBRA|nr:uncharacterized protein K450DRAFT_226621 [Umbelopsis ramanniana AG]KAI8582728.1 hypothetical protein K450DRAFT_226621 [Umbelopsis ramanniana AG]
MTDETADVNNVRSLCTLQHKWGPRTILYTIQMTKHNASRGTMLCRIAIGFAAVTYLVSSP